MTLSDAIKKRVFELVEGSRSTLTSLCINSKITPSTMFDFMSGKSKHLSIVTIKKLCNGANLTLKQFFSRDYFNSIDEDI